ncbi:MAG: hypothetical protein WCO20_01710, partial [Holophagaceae bacterium]
VPYRRSSLFITGFPSSFKRDAGDEGLAIRPSCKPPAQSPPRFFSYPLHPFYPCSKAVFTGMKGMKGMSRSDFCEGRFNQRCTVMDSD